VIGLPGETGRTGCWPHSIIMNAGHLPNDTAIKSLGDGIGCVRVVPV
jgi:hypothetical protein